MKKWTGPATATHVCHVWESSCHIWTRAPDQLRGFLGTVDWFGGVLNPGGHRSDRLQSWLSHFALILEFATEEHEAPKDFWLLERTEGGVKLRQICPHNPNFHKNFRWDWWLRCDSFYPQGTDSRQSCNVVQCVSLWERFYSWTGWLSSYEAFGSRLREEPNALFIQCHEQELQASRLRFSPRLPPSRLDQASQLSGLLGDDRGRLGSSIVKWAHSGSYNIRCDLRYIIIIIIIIIGETAWSSRESRIMFFNWKSELWLVVQKRADRLR